MAVTNLASLAPLPISQSSANRSTSTSSASAASVTTASIDAANANTATTSTSNGSGSNGSGNTGTNSSSTASSSQSGTASSTASEDSSLSFGDFIDLINPLQHIPIVSSIYRAVTGDQISDPMRILGGALYGGVIGFAANLAYTVVDEASGGHLEERAMASLGIGEAPAEDGTDTAVASTEQQDPAASQQSAAPVDPDSAPRITIPAPPLPTVGNSMAAGVNSSPLGAAMTPVLPVNGGSSEDVQDVFSRLAADIHSGAYVGGASNLNPHDATRTITEANTDPADMTSGSSIWSMDPGAAARALQEADAARQQKTRDSAMAVAKTQQGKTVEAAQATGAVSSDIGTAHALTPPPDMATAMMQGLDKYDAMLRARKAMASPPGQLANQTS
ncbi:hypothetical protein [Radicibacter daui]|uniref:hypothetical protein n=1 Tax=Radicibacter daui TaxID=3064829 RepID=UPI004046A85F